MIWLFYTAKVSNIMTNKHPLIGAHTSAQGGAFNALYSGEKIGASTVQLFTANQKRWVSKPLSKDAIDAFHKAKDDTGITTIMSHGSYLINLASPSSETHSKSVLALRDELERCTSLGITYLNIHPGSFTSSSLCEGITKIADSLNDMKDVLLATKTMILLETTAGQGSQIGSTFEDMNSIISLLDSSIPIGVCIDTCHSFAAGYRLSTLEEFDATIQDFSEKVGIDYLKAIHCNNSLKPFASHRDRHANLEDGEIGIDGFKALMTHSATKNLPIYLETPNGDTMWEKEIQLLHSFYN